MERSVVMEIMGYRAPPEPLLPVFEALCLLFDRPTTLVHVHIHYIYVYVIYLVGLIVNN